MEIAYIVSLLLLLVVVVFAVMRRFPRELPPEDFGNPLLSSKPTLWWFVDTEPNARYWLDFTGRQTTEPNRGYLSIALDAVRRTQGADFDVKPLIGRDAVLAQIPGAPAAAKQLPPALWRRWAIANLLAANGGLVMDGNSTLCVGPSFKTSIGDSAAAVFGITSDEPIASPATALAPGPAPYVGWAAKPHHPAWRHAADVWNALVRRGPQAFTSAEARRTYMTVYEAQKTAGIDTIRIADGGRLPDGRVRQLEDLFGRVSEPADPKTSLIPGTVYVPYDGDDLSRRYEFAWFLRLSPQQIKESDLVWARLAGF
jgi:hypothetical protein